MCRARYTCVCLSGGNQLPTNLFPFLCCENQTVTRWLGLAPQASALANLPFRDLDIAGPMSWRQRGEYNRVSRCDQATTLRIPGANVNECNDSITMSAPCQAGGNVAINRANKPFRYLVRGFKSYIAHHSLFRLDFCPKLASSLHLFVVLGGFTGRAR
jgi:hypothetical protein